MTRYRQWRTRGAYAAARTGLPAAGTGTALLGTPAGTPWDESLGESMRRTGRAVMEERLLDRLVADLGTAATG
ncbi:DUF2399 domain-containing protein [Micromonospora sp. NPDC047548]|uniref:DUF2399 domain-containing protein n=1 Tax=Micromonospora sp. NPDC047548 TaxID=3155624 RepID=UPI003404234A